MGQRRALVIGSQCSEFPQLSFLPRVAEDLAAVLTEPTLGGWVPALPHDQILLIDPTVAEADQAIETAIIHASQGSDTLLIAFVGHGEYVGDKFYLLTRDAAYPPQSTRAVLLATRIEEMLEQHNDLDGLVVLVDACHSGIGALQAAKAWPKTVSKARGRFELLTSADDREAADGCFTAALTALLRSGNASREENLRCADAKELVQRECGRQVATYLAFDGRSFSRQGDPGLFLGRNQARRAVAPLAGTRAWAQVEQLTAWFERTPQLDQLVTESQAARCVALVGLAGQGKSTLTAALARSELADDLLPPRFLHALTFAAPAILAADLARELAAQLLLTVDEFAKLAEDFQVQTPEEELALLGPLERQVLGPLRLLAGGRSIRIAVDGLDQLTAQAAPAVQAALDHLVSDPELGHVKLVVTARQDVPVPQGARILHLDRVEQRYLERYLRRRGVPSGPAAEITNRSQGNWLVARLLADLALEGAPLSDQVPAGLQAVYQQELRRAGSDDIARWTDELRPVLAVLAAAGAGPVLPLALLCAASGRLNGPDQPTRVRDILVQLRGMVVRSAPGTAEEHVGLFHATFAEYLLADPGLGINNQAAHGALADAIDELAPMDEHDPDDLLHRYAAAAEAEHLWAAGQQDRVLAALQYRESLIPAENLARWTAWAVRLDNVLGIDHPDALNARAEVARWTGNAGNAQEAVRLYQDVLSRAERVLDPDHPSTLVFRADIALWTGQSGNRREQVRLCSQVLDDMTRVLGADHRDTLTVRRNLATALGETGDLQAALRLSRDTMEISERAYGPHDPVTFNSRLDVAFWSGKTGDVKAALQSSREVLEISEQQLGPNHPDTVAARDAVGYWTAEAGDPQEALRWGRETLANKERLLGPDHLETLAARHNVVALIGDTGDIQSALELALDILNVSERVLPSDDPNILLFRNSVASLTGRLGNAQEAAQQYTSLLGASERILGPDHPTTLIVRRQLAFWTGRTGNIPQAMRLHGETLQALNRVLGPDHPTTLSVRHELAYWTGQNGDAQAALHEFRRILTAQERVLNSDNPHILATRHEVATWTWEIGDTQEALRLFREVLADRKRVLGADHPKTLTTLYQIASLIGKTGNGIEALRLSRENLEASERTLGANHPQTLTVRLQVANWTGKTGNADEALLLSREVLAARVQVLGPDHPETISARRAVEHWEQIVEGRRDQL